ncbi:MAG: hypothetical protein WCT15_07095, partial [Candidatus Omnitrophota bacterium]
SSGNKALSIEVRDSTDAIVAQDSIGGGVAWKQANTIKLAGGTTYKVRFIYTNNGVSTGDPGESDQTAWVDRVEVAKPIDYVQAFDSATVPTDFTVGGSANVAMDATTKHAGSYALKIAGSGPGSMSSIEKAVDTSQNSQVSFWRKVSSEGNYDYLRFYIDGVEQGDSISGDRDWEQATYTLSSGHHILKWEYTKDTSVDSLSDAAWVDDLVINQLERVVFDLYQPAETSADPIPLSTVTSVFTTSTTGPWVLQSSEVYGTVGGYALQAGTTGPNSSSYIERTVTIEGASTLDFKWMIKDTNAALRFQLVKASDMSVIATDTRTSGMGTTYAGPSSTIALNEAGTYILRWTYDRTGAAGSDNRAWVDEVNVTFNAVNSPPTEYLGKYHAWTGYKDNIDDFKFKVTIDGQDAGEFLLPWFHKDSGYNRAAVETYLSEGSHKVRFEWVNDYGTESELAIKEIFLADRNADLNNDYYVDAADETIYGNGKSTNTSPYSLTLASIDYTVNKIDDGLGGHFIELRRFLDMAKTTTTLPGTNVISLDGNKYTLAFSDIDQTVRLGPSSIISMPFHDGEIEFKSDRYYYDVSYGTKVQLERSKLVAGETVTGTGVNKESRITIYGKTFDIIKDQVSGKIILEPSVKEHVDLSVSALAGDKSNDDPYYLTGSVNFGSIVQHPDDIYMNDGQVIAYNDDTPTFWQGDVNIVTIDRMSGRQEFTSWDISMPDNYDTDNANRQSWYTNGGYARLMAMINYLEALRPGTIVMVATKAKKGFKYVNESTYFSPSRTETEGFFDNGDLKLYKLLNECGSQYVDDLAYKNTSWEMIGYKGMAAATAYEKYQQTFLTAVSDTQLGVSVKDEYAQTGYPQSMSPYDTIKVDGEEYQVKFVEDGDEIKVELYKHEEFESYDEDGTQKITIDGYTYTVSLDADGRPVLLPYEVNIHEPGQSVVTVDGKQYAVTKNAEGYYVFTGSVSNDAWIDEDFSWNVGGWSANTTATVDYVRDELDEDGNKNNIFINGQKKNLGNEGSVSINTDTWTASVNGVPVDGSILGGYKVGSVKKVWENIPSFKKYRISFDFYYIDDWSSGNKDAYLVMNGD